MQKFLNVFNLRSLDTTTRLSKLQSPQIQEFVQNNSPTTEKNSSCQIQKQHLLTGRTTNDSDIKNELRSIFFGSKESDKSLDTISDMPSSSCRYTFNYMSQENTGIKLAPRQLRELTDANSIAIMTVTLAKYCKMMCDVKNPHYRHQISPSSHNSKSRNDLIHSSLKSSTFNFDTISFKSMLSTSNCEQQTLRGGGPQSGSGGTAADRKRQVYEMLRKPEEELRWQVCEQIVLKLSEVRTLVSQVVVEEEDDEVR